MAEGEKYFSNFQVTEFFFFFFDAALEWQVVLSERLVVM